MFLVITHISPPFFSAGADTAQALYGYAKWRGRIDPSRHRHRVSDRPVPVSGPYRWVRHPLYSCAITIVWLFPSMTVNRAALFAVTSLYFYLGSFPEERKLVQEFGQAYQEYQRRVPRLIPFTKT